MERRGASDTIVEKLLVRRKKEEEEEEEGEVVVLDGKDIRELVGDEEVFSSYAERKFEELDVDRDGKLSLEELQPAVADIGAALRLTAQRTLPDSDNIFSQVLNEFTHGKQEEVTKTEFKEALSDILLGMVAAIKRDPVVILRIDGEDLEEFIRSPAFESQLMAIYSNVESEKMPLMKCITMALEQLTVEHGLPPSSDSWVMQNIVEPALCSASAHQLEQFISQEVFLMEFKKVVENITHRLREHPVIVAHSENAFDGGDIRRLLSNEFELDQLLDVAWRDMPKNINQRLSKEYLSAILDGISPSIGLTHFGVFDQVDAIVNAALAKVNVDDGGGSAPRRIQSAYERNSLEHHVAIRGQPGSRFLRYSGA